MNDPIIVSVKKEEITLANIKFVLGRLVTMVVEVGGVPFCVELLGQPKMVAKIETQVIVVIVNYFISKLFVFKSGSEQDK